jgi:hypothetical protein
MYKIGEWARAENDFKEVFKIGLRSFYYALPTMLFKRIYIDICEFDDYLHTQHGRYEDAGKSMRDIIVEHYGERGMKLIEELI